ncbi:Exoribonuclease R, partial [Gordonibacter pamelaeae 7-10-1-b]
MARKRSHTRRSPRSNPRGVLTVHGGGFGFVQTAEGAYFVPASKMAGAFDGDLVEVAPLPPTGGKGGARQPHQGAATWSGGLRCKGSILRERDALS